MSLRVRRNDITAEQPAAGSCWRRIHYGISVAGFAPLRQTSPSLRLASLGLLIFAPKVAAHLDSRH